ncbi:Proline dehydrogenase (Proline oxidase) / Delta-1-pyrroline-5-carboxylate dehydrogenase [Paramagnetospirillum magnetotacticum MS-1]|uniref:Bifunctional protein PutA n=1 Tax=Paramagnetospirillum magnetotacticum MS-1 TaxID=272627 RepID=A0A0C2YW39_PARME|nr:bifunctional proline dehydrogenase/L-glutamate gamma-semialdehyde dehydrogenase PutA [Paramagnetospirillum magnetotacticum]KIL98920.1 Proline dehydrogenase (Proline oxidase) / Delta-1-pyrroline-5-carboxylate dehydrogenase [Paramagnetospirillum magnetotacticum MS-1]
MIFTQPLPSPTAERLAIHQAAARDEADLVSGLAAAVPLEDEARRRAVNHAVNLVDGARQNRRSLGLDGFLNEYRLSTREGVVMMCLAEALLRIPDDHTADLLIKDKIGSGDWDDHLGHSPSLFVNASTWALVLGDRLLHLEEDGRATLGRMAGRLGEAVVRRALRQAMGLMGRQFVMGRSIAEALDHARAWEAKGYLHSFDMLGEAARCEATALDYVRAYTTAIEALGRHATGDGVIAGPGISVKLSALHPRFEMAQRGRVMAELVPRLRDLCLKARHAGIGLTIDAEEADRLEISLDVIEAALSDSGLDGWSGFGMAIQAYQKRARPVIAWAGALAARRQCRLMIRLVKGAYWDGEIKRAQERGLHGFPVFTAKEATDVSYLACAADLLARPDLFYPQFATHNAHTVAAIVEMTGGPGDWEFQRLHGMGEALYAQLVPQFACRIYAPVGSHQDLLPYLVRRLLENGANSSFVSRLADEDIPAHVVAADPLAILGRITPQMVAAPSALFEPQRRNSSGLDLSSPAVLAQLDLALAAAATPERAHPIIDGQMLDTDNATPVLDPADHRRIVGEVVDAHPAQVAAALASAHAAFPAWDDLGGEGRAAILDKAAEMLEDQRARFMALAIREAGKTLPDALGEVREAVDFLRFYAAEARTRFAHPLPLPGPVGESNHLMLGGRGVFACISPWNFPLAIFMGQVAAALAAGNTVVAKPAPQTPLMAAAAVRLLHAAGVPPKVLHLVPGGPSVGEALVSSPMLDGISFTGSTATARQINRIRAAMDGPLLPLIAETGGLNAMIVDSSALAEQVVADCQESAFRSAGQRCSALRIAFIQREAWTRIEPLLAGAMAELSLGDPALLSTDVGPVIDEAARQRLLAHGGKLRHAGRAIGQSPFPADCRFGTFFAPMAYELENLDLLRAEVFGPILHVITWESGHLDKVLDAVAATSYGLTLGIHSRIDATIAQVVARARIGNIYVNRAMIGAVVGSQPFGGLGLSGTGAKAGGPNTLIRYGVERCLSVNTAAAGGDAALMAGPQRGHAK